MRDILDALAEIYTLRDDEKIDVDSMESTLARLHIKRLCGILTRHQPLRRLRLRQWLRDLSTVTSRDIKLLLTKEEVTPYMREEGEICFCERDLYREEKLFMLLTHESAHFLLMQDAKYESIKALDREYLKSSPDDAKMNSPIEGWANFVTLMILLRCYNSEKSRKKREIIEKCIKTLKKQLTK